MADVLVVGGGPAGASTAIHLARKGLRVQLLDRATFPRAKVCGEGLFPGGVEALADLGVLDHVRDKGRALQSLRVELDGASVEGRLPDAARPALGVRRSVLDAAILDCAGAAGVEVCLGVTALDLLTAGSRFRGVRTDAGDFEANAIVLADGLRSRLRRVAGLEARGGTRRYGVSAHFGLREEAEPRVHIRMLDGYEVYLTPVGRDEVNVAILAGGQRARGFAGRLQAGFQELVRDAGLLPEGAELVDVPAAAGPFPARARRLWRENLVLAGDAGGFFDGISGEGMSLALVASKAAAEAIAAYIADGSPAHSAAYAKARRRIERNSTLLARVSLALASHRRLGRYAIANLGKHPATFEKILAINAGLRGLSILRPRDFSRLLLGL